MTYKLTNTSLNPDPYYGAVSLLLSGDGANNSTDIRDSSRNTKVVTAVADAKISTAQSKWNGSSLAFDGNYDYLSIPDNDDWDISGDYTVEFWARMPSQSTASYTLGYFGTAPINAAYGFALGHYLGAVSLTLNGTLTTSSAVLLTNTWQHIALVISGASAKVYVDGVSVISTTSATTTTSTSFIVGNFGDLDANRYFNGYIDDLRITKGVARYTANFTPPTQPFLPTFKVGADPEFYNTSLLLHGDGANGSTTIIDSSYNTKTITVAGNAQISTAQSKFGGSSLAFDGSGDYLSAGDSVDHSLSGVPFTVEAWIYPTSYASGANFNEGRTVVGKWSDTGIPAGWRLEINTSSIIWYTNLTIRHSTAISLNQWTHIAVCGDGTTSSMYKNGVKVSGPSSDVFSNSVNKPLIVGALLFGSFEYYFDGYIDELRITKGIARYTSDFTPPTAPFPNF